MNSFEVIAKNLVGQENFTNATVVTMNVALTGAKVSTVISITVNNLSLVHKVMVLPTLRFGSSLVDRYAGYAEVDFWPIASGASAGASGSCGFA